MYQNLGNMATMINYKDTGIYPTEEFVCGQMYFKDPSLDSSTSKTPKLRNVYRKVINFGALPAAGATVTKAHGITIDANFILTRLYGAATDPVALKSIPLPYVSGSAPTTSVGLSLDATNLIAISSPPKGWATYNKTYIVIEYLKF